MNKFVLIVEFQVKPECLERFNQAIAINAKASVANEPGCRQFDVTRAQDDPCKIVLYEVYDSEDAFRAHLSMAHTQAFLGEAKELVTKQTATRLLRTVAPPVKSG